MYSDLGVYDFRGAQLIAITKYERIIVGHHSPTYQNPGQRTLFDSFLFIVLN